VLFPNSILAQTVACISKLCSHILSDRENSPWYLVCDSLSNSKQKIADRKGATDPAQAASRWNLLTAICFLVFGDHDVG
jgi:hypothetical protein